MRIYDLDKLDEGTASVVVGGSWKDLQPREDGKYALASNTDETVKSVDLLNKKLVTMLY